MPFLTTTEKAEVRDHLGWDNASIHSHYVNTVLNPSLDEDMDEAKLVVVRGHLGRLNGIYAQLAAAPEDFGIDEVKGIKFSRALEGRLGGMYAFWQSKLAQNLNLKINAEPIATTGCSGRIILD